MASLTLEPGTIYATLDEAMHAASCLSGLHHEGATIHGTTDPAFAIESSGEAYAVSTEATRPDGETWPVPPIPFHAIYTIIRKGTV